MGRGGLYYRKTLPSSDSSDKQQGNPNYAKQPYAQHDVVETLTEIDSSDISQMVDSSSAELINELNKKRKMIRLWPIAGIISTIIVFILLNSESPVWATTTAFVLGISGTVAAFIYDRLRKTTVIFFNLEPEIEKLYQSLHDAFDKLAACASKWHIEAQGDVKDRKRNAGATNMVKRSNISFSKESPPYVKTNIVTPCIPVGRQRLYFFPDKVLVFASNGVGAVSYSSLEVDIGPIKYIENGSVPRDAQVVDRTWKYVNKGGGPDRRFKDNKELPIVLYEEINFKSATGLNERIQVSQVGQSSILVKAIQQLDKDI